MVIDISYSVAFSTSQTTLKGKFQPKNGITAVVGENGSGKTFSTVELTAYLLYGKKALRGAASDYKTLHVTGRLEIKGAVYTVVRTPKKEEVTDNAGVVLAVGAEAVTKKMTELMGYGLPIFKIANASMQKQTHAFGAMKPAERKRMIDDVIGLTSYGEAEKACRTEASAFQREAEALTRNLRTPVKPAKPKRYIPSDDLVGMLDDLRRIYSAAQRAANKIRPAFDPVKPLGARPTDQQIEKMAIAESARQDALDRQKYLRSFIQRAIFYCKHTAEELDAAEHRLSHGSSISCPKCAHVFHLDGADVDVEAPELTAIQIAQCRKGLEDRAAHDKAVTELNSLVIPDDKSADLRRLRQLKADWETYDYQMEQQEEQLEANRQAEKEFHALGNIPSQGDIDLVSDALIEARTYEAAIETYKEDKAQMSVVNGQIVEKIKLAKEFKKGAEAISDARATVKAHLAPALSRVASGLLQDMTHGKLSVVDVDEDMEITINGQRIETLSGGGETVANIALRIALGRVLVSQTFPVFFGDEMDADADESRRQAVLEALQGLKDHFKQIILITHRQLAEGDVDHVIELPSIS